MWHAEPRRVRRCAVAAAAAMDPGNVQAPASEPEGTPQANGTIARLIRQGDTEWGRQRWPAGRCRTALRAAQLRLALGFFQAERLTACCPLELDADVSETVAACIRVRALTPEVPWVVVLGGCLTRVPVAVADRRGAPGCGRPAAQGGGGAQF